MLSSSSSSLYCLSQKPVSFPFDNNSNDNNKVILVGNDFLRKHKFSFSSSSSSSVCSRLVCWVEKEREREREEERETEWEKFEVDKDKAREALKQLDQQLQSLSQKQIRSPKIKASEVNLTSPRDQTKEEVEEFSGSFLAYTAGALFLLTILYNVLFYTVIKPSIDGVEEAPTKVVERQITE